MPTTLKDLATIETLAKTSPEKAADAYKKALTLISSGSADTDARLKEVATLGLGDVYKRLKCVSVRRVKLLMWSPHQRFP